jgi:plastocyanin
MAGRHLSAARAAVASAIVVIIGVAALPSVASAAETATTPGGVTVRAGVNAPKDPTIAVLRYLPEKITVKVDTPVTWTWKGALEPHSVTFLAPGQQLPPPGSDPTLFAPTQPTGPYDGTSFVNSGLQPLPPAAAKPMTMTFSKPGKFSYYCVIHPTMVGEINVVDSGKTDSKQAVAKRGAGEMKRYIAEGTAAKKVLDKTKRVVRSGGVTTWIIQMGKSTPHTDILAFAPTPKKIKAGDHIQFVNNSQAPHTGTFVGEQEPITNPVGPQTDDPAPGPSPQTLNATALFNTGLIPPNAAAGPDSPAPPREVRSYTYVVPAAGKYPYYCILHVGSGMGGTIRAS